jgi:hypothetical protein
MCQDEGRHLRLRAGADAPALPGTRVDRVASIEEPPAGHAEVSALSVFAFQVRGAAKEIPMRFLNSIGVTALATALITSIGVAAAFDDSKYQDINVDWIRFV